MKGELVELRERNERSPNKEWEAFWKRKFQVGKKTQEVISTNEGDRNYFSIPTRKVICKDFMKI